jgi:hypothetical protein
VGVVNVEKTQQEERLIFVNVVPSRKSLERREGDKCTKGIKERKNSISGGDKKEITTR